MKNYKIVKILPLFYREPIIKIYQEYPHLCHVSYDEQKVFINAQGFVHLNGFAQYMNQLGNEAYEIICDVEILQKTWAKENNKHYDEESWSWQILLHQIYELKPDILYLQDIHPLPHIIRRQLKKDFPFIKLMVMFKGFPSDPTELSDIDILFAGIPSIHDIYKSYNYASHLLYHCINPNLISIQSDIATQQDPIFDFTFFGSSGFGTGGNHQNRYETLHSLLNKTNIHCWLSETDITKITNNHTRPLRTLFPTKTKQGLFGKELFDGLRKSKITFNIHTDRADGFVGNMRMFEATGAGACLLTDTGHNIKDIFEPDKEIVTYSSVEECIEKAQYLLSHDEERKTIAKAGQARTLRDHTTMRRCETVHEILQAAL